MHNNENSHKYEGIGNDESIKYIIFLFVTYSPPFYKESNRLTDLNKKTKILNYFVYKLIISKSDNC